MPQFKANNNYSHLGHPQSIAAQAAKAKAQLSEIQKEIIFAMALTDATVAPKVSGRCKVKFEQGWKQVTFVAHLWEIFQDYSFQDTPTPTHEKLEIANSAKVKSPEIKSYWFWTFVSPIFVWLREELYPNGTKVYTPGLVGKYMTELGFTYMVMADGSRNARDNVMNLATHSFGYKGNKDLVKDINAKFALNGKIQRDEKHYFIAFPAEDRTKLQAICEPYLLPAFRYKLIQSKTQNSRGN